MRIIYFSWIFNKSKKLNTLSVLFLCLITANRSFAQSIFSTNNEYIESISDRLEILSPSDSQIVFTGMKPYRLQVIASQINSIASNSLANERKYGTNELYPWGTQVEIKERKKSFLTNFYTHEASLYEAKSKDFFFKINPVLELKLGKESNNSNLIYTNSRGVEVQGFVGKNIGFYFNMTENQSRYNNYIINYSKGFNSQNAYNFNPGFGYWKEFGTNGFDYSNSVGYINFSTKKYFNLTFGHDRNFYGYGMRSLLLGDGSAPYLFLKANLDIWKFNYQVLFTEFTGQYIRGADHLLPSKYGAFHLLTLRPSKKWELALYESVIFQRTNGYDLNYLNPMILYRSLEHNLGSPDNSMLGFQAKYNLKKSQIYTQLMLDDIQFKQLINGSGWWANKYAFQLGGKIMNLAKVDHLDLQGEFNYVRPFVYSQYSTSVDTLSNFTHYNQSLAHPLGANFTELMMKLTYQPSYRWRLELLYSLMTRGLDTGSILYGNDILANTKVPFLASEFNTKMLQGVRNQIHFISLNTSYMLWHNVFLDLDLIYRKSNCDISTFNYATLGFQTGIRCNLRKRKNIN